MCKIRSEAEWREAYYREVENSIRRAEEINRNAVTVSRKITDEERDYYIYILKNRNNQKNYFHKHLRGEIYVDIFSNIK